MRIAFAGFQHETNTFAPTRADLDVFMVADSWPPLLRGAALIEGVRGLNLPVAGALAAAQERADVEIAPILWCAAEPSGPVTRAAFETISGWIIAGLRDAAPLDGVYLDLHGAMVTEDAEDGEGALLERVRAAIGPNVPIVVSLDLHANISPQMARAAAGIAIFRTYPHLDMAETGARALRMLLRAVERGAPRSAFRQAPFLPPAHAQRTDRAPCQALYGALDAATADPDESLDLAMGFSAADIYDCGASVVAYAASQARADALADAALDRLLAAESAFDAALTPADAAVEAAMAHRGSKPVVIADVQDNPGAGASSDTTGLLRALVEHGADQALLGLIHDPTMASAAHRAGAGATIEGALGGRSGVPGDAPLEARFEVIALSDGRIPYQGRMYGGGVAEIGPSCLLRLRRRGADIRIAVSSRRSQCLDRCFFTAFGADPSAARIICVKSTAHFIADFGPIADRIIAAAAPGLFPCDPSLSTYRNLRPGVRRRLRGG